MKHKYILIFLLMVTLSAYSQQTEVELFDQATIKVSEVQINTVESDFGATLVGDTLFFTSIKNVGSEINNKKRKQNKFYDIFKVCIDQTGSPNDARKNVEEFSTIYHDGPVSSWCAKTAELFITQTNKPQLKYTPLPKEYNNLKISIAKKIEQKWTVVQDFPFNNTGYSVGHPAINETGDTLVFTSDMPEGAGDTDLYLSVKTNGRWGTPLNLGSRINTIGREEFPFLIRNKKGETYLIFSSDKSGGIGGMDIYYIKLNDPNSGTILFESPINSQNDDFALSFVLEKGFGYFSSNRKGTGDDDIYKFTFNPSVVFTQKHYDNNSGSIYNP